MLKLSENVMLKLLQNLLDLHCRLKLFPQTIHMYSFINLCPYHCSVDQIIEEYAMV